MKKKVLGDKHFTVRILHYPDYANSIGRLRYKVFVEQLGWVGGDLTSRTELDHLDINAHHIGVFSHSNGLVGYVRILPAIALDSMLLQQPSFRPLQPLQLEIGVHVAEVSRMCTLPKYQKKPRRGGLLITRLLFRGIYDYCFSNGIRLLYAVVDDTDERKYNHKAFLMHLLPFTAVSGSVCLTPGVASWLLQLDVPAALQRPKVRELLGL